MSVTLINIARHIGAEIPGNAEYIEIRGVTSLEDAGPHDISFLANPRYAHHLSTTRAAAVIVTKDTVVAKQSIPLVVDAPYFSFLQVLELFNTRSPSDIASGVDSLASIHTEAVLGDNVSVGPCAFIGSGVTIGDGTVVGPCSVILKGSTIGKNCVLYPNVTIMDGCELGDRVILHAGVVIGSDGFGFAPHEGHLHKIPQIGRVRIGDDVEIQANTCIDRAAFGETVIDSGTKLDNLVQIGHNVRVGSHTVMAAMTGVSGSTSIGSGVRIGGQAGVAGHLTIGDGSSVGAQAGVTKDVPPGETVSGYPARRHAQELRLEASVAQLPNLIKKIRDQEARITELERILRSMKNENE